jgi:hypothetical protein
LYLPPIRNLGADLQIGRFLNWAVRIKILSDMHYSSFIRSADFISFKMKKYFLLCASFDSLAPARLMRRFSQPASPSELPVGSLSRPSPRSRFALRANLRLLYLVLTLALGCGKLSAATEDPFSKLANDLGKESSGEKVNIAVGSFNYENTDLQSPFSALLRDQLEIALGETGKFKVITRKGLADLQMEGKFQGKEILEPGTGVEKVTIEGVKGIIRGNFYSHGDEVTIIAEIAWLEGGEIKKAQVAIPSSKVKAKIWPNMPDDSNKSLEGAINPQNIKQSGENVESAKDRLAKIPKDFQVEIFTVDGKRAYAEKENISFRVRSVEDCHIAVLCHQSDGTSVVLFPNRFCSNTQIPANKTIDIPGTHKSGFEIEIGPPFGSDVVEVIACSKATELHKQFSQFAAKATDEQPYQTLTRGMAVKGIDTALSSSKNGDASPLKWGQDSIVVSTFPKP